MRLRVKPRFWMLVLGVSLCVAIFATINLLADLRMYNNNQQEYDALRIAYAPDVLVIDESEAPSAPATPGAVGSQGTTVPMTTPSPNGPVAINPDYVGWIRVEGADIDYPVVLGADNEKYLTISFSGEENKLGAIFMDSRCVAGFDAPHTIIYGHNAKDGSMFGSLSRYLDAAYRREHPAIEITTTSGESLTYRILTAQVTDIFDEAFSLFGADSDTLAAFAKSIGAPEGAAILTLSTCTDTGGKDKRLLVHAVRE